MQRKIFKIFSKFSKVQKEKNILIGNIKVNNQNHINNELYLHYKSHYWETARLGT